MNATVISQSIDWSVLDPDTNVAVIVLIAMAVFGIGVGIFAWRDRS